ncbi:choice-of-anchor D domain-containing protein [Cystobacter fuscus]|uniref:choice-of-anchor D domain-containing protein n=1 Tax=Cystobacter fuscus TaxID=43 RepID=UPI0037BFE754
MRRVGFAVLACLVSAACGPALESDTHGPADAVGQSHGELLPDVVITPSILDFGQQTVGTTSAPLAFTVQNNGTEAVHLSFAVNPPFSPRAFDGSDLAPGTSRELKLYFSPTSAGAFSAPIYIFPSSSSGWGFFEGRLTGTGIAP